MRKFIGVFALFVVMTTTGCDPKRYSVDLFPVQDRYAEDPDDMTPIKIIVVRF
jgi:hypothetical protein